MTKIHSINETELQKNAFTLTLNNFTINDPCVNENNEVESCNHGNGICERKYSVNDFGWNCKCTTEFTSGKHCELMDYCKKENPSKSVCTNCTNDNENKQIKCECIEGQEWNVYLKKCISPNNLDCNPENQMLVYKDGMPQCECKEGYVESKNITTTCELFDICNEVHRKQKRLQPSKPCKDEHAKCKISSDNKNETICACESGYINENEIKTKEAVCLPENPCKSCENKLCYKNGGNFICSTSSCDKGYAYISSNKTCVATRKFVNKYKITTVLFFFIFH